jgi:hypothetical protein
VFEQLRAGIEFVRRRCARRAAIGGAGRTMKPPPML